jgi:hypothetical protein
MTEDLRARLRAAFTAGFQWALDGMDKYGDYNGGPVKDGFKRFMAVLSAPSAERDELNKVTVRCDCGREIWQEAGDWITLGEARQAQCSDCLLLQTPLPSPPAEAPCGNCGERGHTAQHCVGPNAAGGEL